MPTATPTSPAAASRRRSPSVRKKDHDEPGMEDLAQPPRDEVEHPRQLVFGREGIPHLDQGLEPVRPALRGLEEPRVLDGYGSLGGEQRHELLVLRREVAAAFFLGQVQVPVGDAAQEDRHPEERVHRRMVGWKPDRPRIVRDVVEPERLGLVDQHTEDPAPARQVADGGDGLRIEPRRHEALELRPVRIDDAERGVPGAGQLGRRLREPLEKRIEREL